MEPRGFLGPLATIFLKCRTENTHANVHCTWIQTHTVTENFGQHDGKITYVSGQMPVVVKIQGLGLSPMTGHKASKELRKWEKRKRTTQNIAALAENTNRTPSGEKIKTQNLCHCSPLTLPCWAKGHSESRFWRRTLSIHLYWETKVLPKAFLNLPATGLLKGHASRTV